METATQALHRLTSYEPGREWTEPPDDPRAVRSFEPNDLDRLPWFYKRYAPSLPRVALPRELPPTTASSVAVLAGTADVPPNEVDLPQLARLLHLSAGVVRTTERPYATWLFRAAGSAGGRFPLELYVTVPEGSPLPAGVHWYDPFEHALVRVGPPPAGGAARVRRDRGAVAHGLALPRARLPARLLGRGTMLAQLLASADSAGLTAVAPDALSRRDGRRACRRGRRARVAGAPLVSLGETATRARGVGACEPR